MCIVPTLEGRTLGLESQSNIVIILQMLLLVLD